MIEVQKRPKLIEPVVVDTAVHPPPLLKSFDEPGLAEHLQVVRHGRLLDPNLVGQLGKVAAGRIEVAARFRRRITLHRLPDEAPHEGQSVGVSEGLECLTQLVH